MIDAYEEIGAWRIYVRSSSIACNACDWRQQSGDICGMHRRLANLGHSLFIAAGLCRAFELGRDDRMRAMLGLPADEDWRPGCGRVAP